MWGKREEVCLSCHPRPSSEVVNTAGPGLPEREPEGRSCSVLNPPEEGSYTQ